MVANTSNISSRLSSSFPTPQQQNHTSKLGAAGLFISLLGLIFFWVPILGWTLWIIGFLFCLVALQKYPRNLAIAGIIVAIINIAVYFLL